MTLVERVELAADGELSVSEAAVLLHENWRSLHGLAVSVLNDRDEAQDAVQDVIVAIIRRGRGFEDPAAAMRYASAAVLNRCRSVLRRRGTVYRYLRRERRDETAAASDERVLLDEASSRILALFDTLPQRQREVLTLRYLHGLTDQEIGAVQRIAAATVRSNASRALANLTRTMKRPAR
jgi:RNA polymerase sigma factor (sigma-70 family)